MLDFRRINDLPPYAFAEINRRKEDAVATGNDIIDLGFGNPDIPSPQIAVESLASAAQQPANHRYSASRGITALRQAAADRYRRRFGVELDPETEVIATIGAKEGLAHLMWVLLQPGDAAIVPEPSYPIHIYGPAIAGAEIRPVSLGDDYFDDLVGVFRGSWPRPRVIIASFPHNPTTSCVDLEFLARLVRFAHDHEVFLVHDFAYADIGFDGYRAPSLMEVPGAADVGVELYSMTKGHSMPGWRLGFVVGNPAAIAALGKLKSYLDYGSFQPVQIAAAAALDEGDQWVGEVNSVYQDRRDVLVNGLADTGWKVEKPRGTMFVWAPIPDPYLPMGSIDFSIYLLDTAGVAVSPGIGFGSSGEGHVRFALVEGSERISAAVERMGDALDRL